MYTAEIVAYGSFCEDCYTHGLPSEPKGPDWPIIRRDTSRAVNKKGRSV